MSKKEVLILIVVGIISLVGGFATHQHWMKEHERFQKEQAENQAKRIVYGDYVKLSRMYCDQINHQYYPKDLKKMNKWDRTLVTCGVSFHNFYLRYTLIRYKQIMFYHPVTMDSKGNITIEKYNEPYCLVATDRGEVNVQEACERIP